MAIYADNFNKLDESIRRKLLPTYNYLKGDLKFPYYVEHAFVQNPGITVLEGLKERRYDSSFVLDAIHSAARGKEREHGLFLSSRIPREDYDLSALTGTVLEASKNIRDLIRDSLGNNGMKGYGKVEGIVYEIVKGRGERMRFITRGSVAMHEDAPNIFKAARKEDAYAHILAARITDTDIPNMYRGKKEVIKTIDNFLTGVDKLREKRRRRT